jgi:hypothetical protein
MMKQFIQVKAGGGSGIILEINEDIATVQPGVKKAGLQNTIDQLFMESKIPYEEVFKIIRTSAEVFSNQLKNITDAPDEVEMSFGISASGKLGGRFVISAETSGNTNFEVKLKWNGTNK